MSYKIHFMNSIFIMSNSGTYSSFVELVLTMVFLLDEHDTILEFIQMRYPEIDLLFE